MAQPRHPYPPGRIPAVPGPTYAISRPAEHLQGIDLSRQTDRGWPRPRVRAAVVPSGSARPARQAETVRLGCVDCHGGDPAAADTSTRPRLAALSRRLADLGQPGPVLHALEPRVARVHPVRQPRRPAGRPPELRHGRAATPTRSSRCRKSMMTHGAMLWGAALYNNGSVPLKRPRFGESYSMHGAPQRLQTVPPPTPEEIDRKGVVPFLDPLPRFEASQPGNILRIFERGRRDSAGDRHPRTRSRIRAGPTPGLSDRGLGTRNRTDPVFVGLQKTRLLDPTLNFLGTNDHPGDYRSSGCTACHVIYANDRSPVHSGPVRRLRPPGPQLPARPDHPARTSRAIRSSTSSSRASPPASASSATSIRHERAQQYLGYMWWDEETDGELMYPDAAEAPDRRGIHPARMMSNPDETAARGQLVRPGVPRAGRRAEPAGAAHAVRRLPRPRLGLPRRLQEGPHGQPARPPRASRSATHRPTA